MLKRTSRIYALSLVGGALLLGGASVAADAMTLPKSLLGVVTEQSTAAIFTVALTLLRSSKFGGAAMAGGIAAGVGIAAVGKTVRRSPKACNAE